LDNKVIVRAIILL